ncbi:hypothetical protein MMC16_004278 [Acarospora aff. strigata]|nr:hypothetical protein [Acarospora aff. strigata]
MPCKLSSGQVNEASNNDREEVTCIASNNPPLSLLASGPDTSGPAADRESNGQVGQSTLPEGPNWVSHEYACITPMFDPDDAGNRPLPASLPASRECMICTEAVGDTSLYPCRRCKGRYCVSCVKSMFMTACKDESRMPPRCCHILQLHSVRPYLSQQEADLYRAKLEEWSTVHRVYCPVPTCSAFIPNRLIPALLSQISPQSKQDDPEENGHAAGEERQPPSQTVTFGTGTTPPSTTCTPVSSSPPTMSCPQCAAQICGSCKQLRHPGAPCNKDDLDPELAALFKRWKIKRCVKCRTAVKGMFGCAHIRCRCGAGWCWFCQDRIEKCSCPASATDIGDDADDQGETGPDGLGVEDLDAAYDPWALSGLDFGEEPNDAPDHPWNCEGHTWQRLVFNATEGPAGKAECQRCWKEAQVVGPLTDGIKTGNGEIVAKESTDADSDGKISSPLVLPFDEDVAYECVSCGVVFCYACKLQISRVIDEDASDSMGFRSLRLVSLYQNASRNYA